MKLIIGLILAVCVGIGCRFFGIPLPGPPAIMGAAMAVAMATGYTATDYWLVKTTTSKNAPVASSPHPHETSSVAAGASNSELR
jgi:XapX domain-containing protein